MYREEIEQLYGDKKVQKEILAFAENREIVPVNYNGKFGSRPNMLMYPADVEAFVKEGALSLHGSVERWSNPLALHRDAKKTDLDALRMGWDLIIDIDCDRGLEYAKKAAVVLFETLTQYGIKNYSIKYSGNRGFHIGVPFEAFPHEIEGIGTIDKQYPKVPRMIIEYLSEITKPQLKEIFGEDPDKVLKLDAAVAASRHLIRAPYCFHRKTGRVSLPFAAEADAVMSFEPETATATNVETTYHFLDRNVKKNEATELLRDIAYWNAKKEGRKVAALPVREFERPGKGIPMDYFPPCMKNILGGIADGKKRSVFALVGFLHNVGWTRADIEKLLADWNTKNAEPIKDSFIKTTVNAQYAYPGGPRMAPNCDNLAYYKDFGVCTPDAFCKVINNPVSYAKRRAQPKLGKGRKAGPRKKRKSKHAVPREDEQFEHL